MGFFNKGIRAAGRPIIASDNVLGRHIDDVLKDQYRMPTVLECERFQGLPDGYCRSVSKTQALKALGNGWQVDTIAHIFSDMVKNEKKES